MDDSNEPQLSDIDSFLVAPQSTLNIVRGGHHLWDPSLVPIYITIILRSQSPVILEAVTGIIQNLTACDWQPSAALRKHVSSLTFTEYADLKNSHPTEYTKLLAGYLLLTVYILHLINNAGHLLSGK